MKKRITQILALMCVLALSVACFFACSAQDTDGVNEPPSATAPENSGSDPDTGDDDTAGENGMNASDKEVYAAAYRKIVDVFAGAVFGNDAAASALAYPLTAQDDIYTQDPSTGTMWFVGAMTYVYLVTELYNNDTFVITEKPVEYTLSTQSGTYISQTHIIMTAAVDTKTESVRLEYRFETQNTDNGADAGSQENYIYIDAAYDFSANEVETLIIHIWDRLTDSTVISARYNNGAFKAAAPEYADEVSATIRGLLAAFEGTMDQKITLGDYSAEYERTNEYMNSLLYGDSGDDESEAALREKYSAACETIVEDVLAIRADEPSSALVFAEEIGTEPEHRPASQADVNTVRGVSAFIGMLGEMLTEDSFLLTDNAVQFTASYENGSYSETFRATLAYKFDEQNDKLFMSWDVDSQSSYGQANIFLYMNIDYDFDGNALLGFHIKSVQQQSGQTVSFSYKYSNAALTVFSSTKNDYDAYFQPEYDALQAMISAAIDLQADYTTAYTNAMNLVNSAA